MALSLNSLPPKLEGIGQRWFMQQHAMREEGDVLPVVKVSVSLSDLCAKVDEMTAEEEVVDGGDGKGVAHEGGRVTAQSEGHGS